MKRATNASLTVTYDPIRGFGCRVVLVGESCTHAHEDTITNYIRRGNLMPPEPTLRIFFTSKPKLLPKSRANPGSDAP
jgi:hypothetical protein